MAPNHSKLGRMLWPVQDLPIHEIKMFSECCTMLLDVEEAEEDDDYLNVSTLCTLYIHQQLTEMSGVEVWLCCFSFNNSAGTAWPSQTWLAENAGH